MSSITSENRIHAAAVLAAEGVRQTAVAAAGNSQSAVRNAEIAFARACLASAKSNNGSNGAYPFIEMLQELGTGGS
jgi:hypothetical protein